MDFNPFKHKISELNTLAAEKGNVLISEPFMLDEYFKRSVVLLTEHSPEGTIGFILNQPIGIQVHELMPDFPECDAPVFLGGPVNPQNLFFIHNNTELPGSLPISNSLYWDGDFDLLKLWLKSGKIKANEVRYFLGYSGWDYTQLNEELNSQSWLISHLRDEIVFQTNTSQLWKKSLQAMGKEQALLADFPEDPNMN